MKRFWMSLLLLVPASAYAKEGDWKTKPPAEWTLEEVREILSTSPWVTTVEVFPAALATPGSGQSKPVALPQRVPLTIRWYSAGIVREATVRGAELAGSKIPAEQRAELTRPSDRFYIVSVTAPETLAVLDSSPLETLVANTHLSSDNGKPIPLTLIKRPAENGGPEALFLFDKGAGIPADAKKLTFRTAAGELKVEARFSADKMVWNGARDLDGDTGPVSADEKRRREIQSAVLSGEAPEFVRAVTDVRIEQAKGEKRPWKVYVFYDPARELSHPAEARLPDIAGRKLGVARRVGRYSSANKAAVQVIVFVDPSKGKAVDYLLGADAETIASLAPESGEKLFKEKLTAADAPAAKPTDGTSAKPATKGKS